MKQTPILFSTPMVQAILGGHKTQTRRVVKGKHLDVLNHIGKDEFNTLTCPYGNPGDLLWVRETFQYRGSNGNLIGFRGDSGNSGFLYKEKDAAYELYPDFKWAPSIHMPKAAARIWLEVVSVKVQMLWEINEQDAVNEGVETLGFYPGYNVSARGKFEGLWCQINGIESWEANPWVWVVEFKRIDKPC